MKYNTANQQSLVNILLRYWQEIMDIEEEFSLRVGGGDMRPRIEYFHDAIRAFTASAKTRQQQARLAVEQLSYDVRALRYIIATPLASLAQEGNFSPSAALVAVAPALVATQKKLDRETKEQLKDLYAKYSVLFSALLRATAENDYLERVDTMNHAVEQVSALMNAIDAGRSATQLQGMIASLDDEKLKTALIQQLPKLKGQMKTSAGVISLLKTDIQKNDKRAKATDKAFHEYCTAQLAIYEESRDMLKQMASSGMNLVGQFVESALRGAKAGRGR